MNPCIFPYSQGIGALPSRAVRFRGTRTFDRSMHTNNFAVTAVMIWRRTSLHCAIHVTDSKGQEFFFVTEANSHQRRMWGDGQEFDCATWLHKARLLSKDEFRREVERELTGKETEPWEIVYFKLYRSQIPVIEQALETAALMLGSDRSRGYCLEMICADFLAGANLDNGDPDVLVRALTTSLKFLSPGCLVMAGSQDNFRSSDAQKASCPAWNVFSIFVLQFILPSLMFRSQRSGTD